MSKIKRITVSNLKAISNQTADFNGATAIITGGNNKGKTTFLRGLFDRIRGAKPDTILKTGEHEGFAECELTTGEKLKWSFDDKTKAGEKLTFITEKDIKTSLTTALRDRYFPPIFDVDTFLASSPGKQREMLQKLVGLDFTDIDKRYKEAYDERTAVNRSYNEKKIQFEAVAIPENVASVLLGDLVIEKEQIRASLNSKYLENKAANDKARREWQAECQKVLTEWQGEVSKMKGDIDEFNSEQNKRQQAIEFISGYKRRIISLLSEVEGLPALVNISALDKHIESLPQPEPKKSYLDMPQPINPPEPTYTTELPDNTPLLKIEQKINDANETNRKAQVYKDWTVSRDRKDEAFKLTAEAEKKVSDIEKDRMALIQSANMPDGFTFTDDGIMYNGLAFTREQLSSSGIYIAALKLAAMTLGEVKTLHFDASFLDKNSLAEIEQWANGIDLQLLIERPDFEGGEITYELIQQA